MDRLTMKIPNGYESINPIDLCLNDYSIINFKQLVDRLGSFEDKEEQGLLIKLPCKVGDTVYAKSEVFGILEYEVESIHIEKETITFYCTAYSKPCGECDVECLDEIEPTLDDFGKTVFLNIEEVK